MYHKYQGCVRKPCGRKDCYCVCRTCKQYSIDELNVIKHNSYKLEKYYLNILRYLAEMISIDPAACFWETENYYWFRYKYQCLRSNLDYLFSSKNIQWNLLYQWCLQWQFSMNVTKLLCILWEGLQLLFVWPVWGMLNKRWLLCGYWLLLLRLSGTHALLYQ